MILTSTNPFSKTRVHRQTLPVQDPVLLPSHEISKKVSRFIFTELLRDTTTRLLIHHQEIPVQKILERKTIQKK